MWHSAIQVSNLSLLARSYADAAQDITDPEAVAIYVARATGFTVRAITSDSPSGQSVLNFTLKFQSLPPRSLLDDLGARSVRPIRRIWGRAGTTGGLVEFELPDARQHNPQPRRILAELASYHPILIAGRSNGLETSATRDAWSIAIRAVISTILTVPILVLVWGTHLPHHGSKAFSTAQFALSTGVLACASPIFVSCFRSLLFLRQVDLGVLITLSTLSAYIFSVAAYVFLVIGRPFADTLFETVGLLVTLVYYGRTIQALARRTALRAFASVGDARCEFTTLIGENGMVVQGMSRNVPSR